MTIRSSARWGFVAALALGCSAEKAGTPHMAVRTSTSSLTADQCSSFAVGGKVQICHL
jgi:hypothetical protein